jgi:gluconate kinase
MQGVNCSCCLLQVLLNPLQAELLLRLQQRAAAGSHFMPPSLLEPQLQQLSYTEDEMHMVFSSSGQTVDDIVNAVLLQRAAEHQRNF